MTVDQIERFLERLSHDEIRGEEMQTLTVGDLDLVNAYLAGRSRAFKLTLLGTEDALSASLGNSTALGRPASPRYAPANTDLARAKGVLEADEDLDAGEQRGR